jgi:salicylate hydroxylase
LIGDAAHPMLPRKISFGQGFEALTEPTSDQGQGGAQAMEDSVALGIVLTCCTREALEKRLQLFEEIRMKRASVMQVFSNAGQDEPEKIHAEASKFIPAETVPSKSTIQHISQPKTKILRLDMFRNARRFLQIQFWI